jgi:hypothetical protein
LDGKEVKEISLKDDKTIHNVEIIFGGKKW